MIKRWLRNWLFKDDSKYAAGTKRGSRGNELVATDSTADDFDDYRTNIRFTVQPARGGIIITSRKYNKAKDENDQTVHIIHDDENVSENIAQIISMELLRN